MTFAVASTLLQFGPRWWRWRRIRLSSRDNRVDTSQHVIRHANVRRRRFNSNSVSVADRLLAVRSTKGFTGDIGTNIQAGEELGFIGRQTHRTLLEKVTIEVQSSRASRRYFRCLRACFGPRPFLFTRSSRHRSHYIAMIQSSLYELCTITYVKYVKTYVKTYSRRITQQV